MKTLKLKAITVAIAGALCIGGIQSAYAGTSVSFYAKDQKGSIAGLTDGNGNLTTTTLNQYNDYGVNQSNGNAVGQVSINYDPYQYSGEYTDNESGLQPLGNGYRYYDPSLMRFTSPDSYPLLNLYAYGSGNPIMEMDPTGHLSMSWQAGVGMGAGIVSGIGLGFLTAGITDFIGVAVAEVLTNAGTSAIGDGVTEAFGGKVSAKQFGLDAGIGAAAGLVGAIAGKAIGEGWEAYKPKPLAGNSPVVSDIQSSITTRDDLNVQQAHAVQVRRNEIKMFRVATEAPEGSTSPCRYIENLMRAESPFRMQQLQKIDDLSSIADTARFKPNLRGTSADLQLIYYGPQAYYMLQGGKYGFSEQMVFDGAKKLALQYLNSQDADEYTGIMKNILQQSTNINEYHELYMQEFSL